MSKLLHCQRVCRHSEKPCLSTHLRTTAVCAQMCKHILDRSMGISVVRWQQVAERTNFPAPNHSCLHWAGTLPEVSACCLQAGWELPALAAPLVCWQEKCPLWLLFLSYLLPLKAKQRLGANHSHWVLSAPSAWLCPLGLPFVSVNALNPSPGSWED